MRCFIEVVNNKSVCVCGEFQSDIDKDPCYKNLEGQSGVDFAQNLSNQALDYFQSSGIFSLFALSVLISFSLSRLR